MSMLVERETSAGSEGARRATGDPAGRAAAGVEDPEVSEQAEASTLYRGVQAADSA